MTHKNRISKEKDANTSIYEAVGKMLLGNVATGRMVNPAPFSLISKAFNIGQDMEYEEAIHHDKRSYLRMYWAFLVDTQIILGTFCTENYLNLFVIKLSFFIFTTLLF